MKIYLDKDGLTANKRKSTSSYDENFTIRSMCRAVFSDGSSCSCWFGAVGESQVDEDDESKCRGTYGISFVDDYGRMSKEAHDFAFEFMDATAETFEAPSIEGDCGPEPDYELLDKLGEEFADKLWDSMTELTERNQLTYAC